MSIVAFATACMTQLEDPAQAEADFNELLELVKTTFGTSDPDRADKLTQLYTDLKDRIVQSPASTRSYFHSAYAGGYVSHILRVTTLALSMASVYKKNGGFITFTKEELVFATLNHDLGKLGNDAAPYYVKQTSDWHKKTLGEMFKKNDEASFFSVYDNTMMWLNQYGISYTANEMLGIKLADGNYDEANKKYLMNNDPFPIRTSLPYIVHWADHMATIIEKHQVLQLLGDDE